MTDQPLSKKKRKALQSQRMWQFWNAFQKVAKRMLPKEQYVAIREKATTIGAMEPAERRAALAELGYVDPAWLDVAQGPDEAKRPE